MEDKKITVCLTSCNRFSLLKQTIDSFLSTNHYPHLIDRFIITEDSGNVEMMKQIKDTYSDKIELIFNQKNLGLFVSLDNMYSQVNTEYIFHCEDDWRFYGNHAFLKDSLDILDERKDIHQIWLRPIYTIKDWVEPQEHFISNNLEFKMMSSKHCGDWCGFSFNPGLRRISDYKKMFPNGYSEFIIPGKSIVFSEHNCNLVAAKQNYRAAILMQDACDHIGQNQSTYK